MKILVIPAIAVILIMGLGIFEHFYVNKKFDDFETKIDNLMVLTAEEKTTAYDIVEVETWWNNFAKKLHVFTPHTIIKDIEFWLAETKGFVEVGNFEFALAKLQVVKTAAKSIPDSYGINFGNIF